MAYVIAPDGTPGEVPDNQLQSALAQGFKERAPDPEEARKASAENSTLRAGGEALARGALPFGIGTSLVNNISSEYEGKSKIDANLEQDARKEANPITAMVGSGAGFALGLGKLKVGAAALGGMMGLSEAVDESMLKNKALTAEHLVAGTVGGALAGKAAELGTVAVGKLASAAVKKVGSLVASDELISAGNRVTTAALKDAEASANRWGMSPDDMLGTARESGVLHRGTGLTADSVDAAKIATQKAQGAIVDVLDNAAQPLNGADAYKNIVGKLAERFKNTPNAREAVSNVESSLKMLQDNGGTWQDLFNYSNTITEKIGNNSMATNKAAFVEARDLIAGYMDKGLKSKSFPELVRKFNGLSAFSESLEGAYAQRGSGGKLTDAVKGAAQGAFRGGIFAGRVVEGAGLGALEGMAGGMAKRRGGFIVGEALRDIGEKGTLQRLADSFEKKVAQRLATAPEILGPYAATLSNAAAQGSMTLLETHAALANSSQGDDYKRRMGIVDEDPATSATASHKMSILDALQAHSDEQDLVYAKAADTLFSGNVKGSPSVGSMSAKDFTKTIGNLRTFVKDAQDTYGRIPGDLRGAAPETMGSSMGLSVAAANFLLTKAPKNPYDIYPEAVRPQWAPSAAEIDRWNRYKTAIEAPAKAIENMSKGYMSTEQVEAIKTVYPATYERLKEQLVERLTAAKSPISYKQKQALALVLGPAAMGMSQQQVQILQQSHAKATADQQQGGMKKPDGRQQVDPQKSYDTQSQKLERR